MVFRGIEYHAELTEVILLQNFINDIAACDAGPDIIRSHLFERGDRSVEKGVNKLKVWDEVKVSEGPGVEAPGSSRVLESLNILLEVNLAIYLYIVIKFGQQKGGRAPLPPLNPPLVTFLSYRL